MVRGGIERYMKTYPEVDVSYSYPNLVKKKKCVSYDDTTMFQLSMSLHFTVKL